MQDRKDIRNYMGVPEGYFGDLKRELLEIPGKETAKPRRTVAAWAAAAAVAVLLVAGGVGYTVNRQHPADYEDTEYEDAMAWLIESGTSLEYINCINNE